MRRLATLALVLICLLLCAIALPAQDSSKVPVTDEEGEELPPFYCPMDLDVRLSVEKSMIGPLRTLGARVTSGGAVRLRLGGTPSQPEVLR